MKSLVPFLVIATIASACGQGNYKSTQEKKNLQKVDSIFSHHFDALNLYLKDRSTDSTGARLPMIYFLENTTGIMSSGTITYIGKVGLTKDDIEKWKQWYNQNKSYLLWDDKNKKILKVQH